MSLTNFQFLFLFTEKSFQRRYLHNLRHNSGLQTLLARGTQLSFRAQVTRQSHPINRRIIGRKVQKCSIKINRGGFNSQTSQCHLFAALMSSQISSRFLSTKFYLLPKATTWQIKIFSSLPLVSGCFIPFCNRFTCVFRSLATNKRENEKPTLKPMILRSGDVHSFLLLSICIFLVIVWFKLLFR